LSRESDSPLKPTLGRGVLEVVAGVDGINDDVTVVTVPDLEVFEGTLFSVFFEDALDPDECRVICWKVNGRPLEVTELPLLQ